MWDECHAVGLLCFFFVFFLIGYQCMFLPHGLTNEYIISILIFSCCKHIQIFFVQKISFASFGVSIDDFCTRYADLGY